jgi:hypothetical protein
MTTSLHSISLALRLHGYFPSTNEQHQRAATRCPISRGDRPATPGRSCPAVVTSSPSVGGIAERQTLVGHCPQRFSGSSLCIVYRGVACTERGQHLNRKALEPPFAVGAFFAQYRLGPPAPTDLTSAEPTADSSPLSHWPDSSSDLGDDTSIGQRPSSNLPRVPPTISRIRCGTHLVH